MPLPWEQMPNERTRSYEQFCRYRDMPPSERTVLGSYRLITGKHAAKGATGSFLDMVERWQWVKRANAWDDHLDQERRNAQIREVRAMAQRQAQQAYGWQQVLIQPVVEAVRRINEAQERNESVLSIYPYPVLFDMCIRANTAYMMAVRMERMARGEPAEVTETRVKARVTGEETAEELVRDIEEYAESFCAIMAQLTPGDGSSGTATSDRD